MIQFWLILDNNEVHVTQRHAVLLCICSVESLNICQSETNVSHRIYEANLSKNFTPNTLLVSIVVVLIIIEKCAIVMKLSGYEYNSAQGSAIVTRPKPQKKHW